MSLEKGRDFTRVLQVQEIHDIGGGEKREIVKEREK